METFRKQDGDEMYAKEPRNYNERKKKKEELKLHEKSQSRKRKIQVKKDVRQRKPISLQNLSALGKEVLKYSE